MMLDALAPTLPFLFRTFETVAGEYPVAAAMSLMLTLPIFLPILRIMAKVEPVAVDWLTQASCLFTCIKYMAPFQGFIERLRLHSLFTCILAVNKFGI